MTGFRFEDGAWFERPGARLVTEGIASTILVPPGDDQLERLADAVRDRLPPDGIATGALGFDTRSVAALDVAARAEWSAPGRIDPPETRGVRELRLEALPDPARYREDVRIAVERIRAGELDKVVLARMLVAHAEEPFDRHRLLSLLAGREPDAYVFAVQGFIGASPELVIARDGARFASRPLAGTRTKARGAAAELLASEKDRREHAIVVDAIADQLGGYAKEMRVDPEPSIVETSSLVHLGTRIEGTLRDPATSVLDLLAAIHPTPAIAGMPREAALRTIRDVERFDRTRYGGPVGWIDGWGNGEFALTLRCAEVRGRIAMLFAGAGIVAASDPDLELAETDAKFEPMRSALERC